MNCLRARSSCASWRCMSLKASASWPSSSSESTGIGLREVAGGDLLGRLLQPLDALRERARDQPAARAPRARARCRRDQDLRAHDRDVALDVGHRVEKRRPRRRAVAVRTAARRPRATGPRRSTTSAARDACPCGRARPRLSAAVARVGASIARVGDHAVAAGRRSDGGCSERARARSSESIAADERVGLARVGRGITARSRARLLAAPRAARASRRAGATAAAARRTRYSDARSRRA